MPPGPGRPGARPGWRSAGPGTRPGPGGPRSARPAGRGRASGRTRRTFGAIRPAGPRRRSSEPRPVDSAHLDRPGSSLAKAKRGLVLGPDVDLVLVDQGAEDLLGQVGEHGRRV